MTVPAAAAQPTREQVAVALLVRVCNGLPAPEGAPQTVAALITWFAAEGGAGPQWGIADNVADYNPLNTTRVWPGSTPTPGNVPPVQAYRSWQDGINATAATIDQPNMAPIADALRAFCDCTELAAAVAATDWGTGDFSRDCPTGSAPPVAPTTTAGPPPSTPPAPPATPTPEVFDVSTLKTVSQQSPGPTVVDSTVASLQAVLAGKWHQGIAVDGRYGPDTALAVENVQRFMALTIDGICGPQTWPVVLELGG